MNTYVSVTRAAPSGLSQQVWRFWLNADLGLRLDDYTAEERPSKRHKFKVTASWSRLYPRSGTIQRYTGVPLPRDVLWEALDLIRAKIKIACPNLRCDNGYIGHYKVPCDVCKEHMEP